MYSCKIMAKSDEKTTLVNHIDDCQSYAEYYLSEYKQVIHFYCDRHNIDYEKFSENLKIAIHYHDFGKATKEWQKAISEENLKLPAHSPFAGFFIFQEGKKNLPSLLASVSHHSLLTSESGNSYKKWIGYTFLEELNNLNQFFNKSVVDISKEKMVLYFQNFFIEKLREHSNNKKIFSTQFKSKYCFFLYLICSADICASKFEDSQNISISKFISEFTVNHKEFKKSISNIAYDKNLNKIQKNILEVYAKNDCKNFLLEAPCGEGKTLSSLLIAKNLIENSKINKVIFALPTQVTTNNMLNEFVEEYSIPENQIGLYHSEVFNFLQSLGQDDDDIKSKIFLDSFFSNSYTISTIDHLLLSLVNGYKYAPRAFGALQTSMVIIDEMHYYEPHTIGMVECLVAVLEQLKIPFFIMSATIPKPVREKILTRDVNYICSTGENSNNEIKQSCKIEFHQNSLFDYQDGNFRVNSESFDLIDKEEELNIGIIVNTVEKAKTIYNELKQRYNDYYQIFIYHSQFTRIHRPIKEKLLKIWIKNQKRNILFNEEIELCIKYNFDLKKPLIVVATQVIEISLNISFDLLITELAPLDSLLQRLGRLHRSKNSFNSDGCNCYQCKRLKSHHYVAHIFETGRDCVPYYFSKEDEKSMSLKKEIIDRTREVISVNPIYDFIWSKNQMDYVYQNPELFDDFDSKKEFWDIFNEDIIFGKSPISNDENRNTRILTRPINSYKFNVLPGEFFYKNEPISYSDFLKKLSKSEILFQDGKFTNKGYEEISKFTVGVSKRYYKDFFIKDNIRIFPFSEYDFDDGLKIVVQEW